MVDKKIEEWVPIVGYEGIYEISDYGAVKRVLPAMGATVGRILKNGRSHNGYAVVCLYNDRVQKLHKIHRLVYLSLVGPCPPGKEVNHIDGNKLNNNLDNLEYVTKSENTIHAYKIGIMSQRGEKNNNSKLTENYVRRIVSLLKEGYKQIHIANKYDVSIETISKINRGTTWSWLTGIGVKT